MRAAQDRREQHPRKRNIIAELCSAGEQRRILNARRVFAQVARLGQRQLAQTSWHFLAQVDQPLFILWFNRSPLSATPSISEAESWAPR